MLKASYSIVLENYQIYSGESQQILFSMTNRVFSLVNFLIIGKSTLKNNDRFASEYLEEARFVWLKVRVLVFERNEGKNKL